MCFCPRDGIPTKDLRCCVGYLGVWLQKTPSELKMQWFRAFVRSWWYHDELSFCCPFRFGHLQFSIPRHPAGGDPRASSSTRGFPEECKHKQNPEGRCRHHKEGDGGHLLHVIGQESSPSLGRWLPQAGKIFGHGRLCYRDP